MYFSYYSAGFRVAKIAGDELTEVGHYIDVGGNNFWGVQVFQHDGREYVAASDRDSGLYIFPLHRKRLRRRDVRGRRKSVPHGPRCLRQRPLAPTSSDARQLPSRRSA